MPRYYCDYCDTYLTHDSPSVRKQHNAGYKHKANVRSYYQQFEQQQTQSLIDQKIKEHLGQAAVYQQVGAAYSQLLAQRPRLPVLPPPVMPIPGAPPLLPGMRPPPAMLPIPRPITSAPGYPSGAPIPLVMVPPGAPLVPGQMSGVPRPPTTIPENSTASSAPAPSNAVPSQAPNVPYQSNPAAPPPGNFDSYGVNASTPESAQ